MRNYRLTAAAVALAAAFVTGNVAAQMEAAPSDVNSLMQEVQQLQQQMQELNQQLTQIQEQAVAQNPELATQRDELMALVEDHMAESGIDAEASRDRIETLRGQVEGDAATDGSSAQELSQQLREEQTRLQQAQSQAMQDAEIQAKFRSANEDLVSAMREENEETDALIEDLQTAQQEYQALMRKAMQSHGSGSPHG